MCVAFALCFSFCKITVLADTSFFDEQVRSNRFFEKFSDFVLAAKRFFRCRTKYKEELCTRLVENFQTLCNFQ